MLWRVRPSLWVGQIRQTLHTSALVERTSGFSFLKLDVNMLQNVSTDREKVCFWRVQVHRLEQSEVDHDNRRIAVSHGYSHAWDCSDLTFLAPHATCSPHLLAAIDEMIQ